MKEWSTRRTKIPKGPDYCFSVLPNVIEKLYLNFLKIPKERHQDRIRVKHQVITGVSRTQNSLTWGGKLQCSLRPEEEKDYSTLRSCLPGHRTKGHCPPPVRSVYSIRDRAREGQYRSKAQWEMELESEEPVSCPPSLSHHTRGGTAWCLLRMLTFRLCSSGPCSWVTVSVWTQPEGNTTNVVLGGPEASSPTNHSEALSAEFCLFGG